MKNYRLWLSETMEGSTIMTYNEFTFELKKTYWTEKQVWNLVQRMEKLCSAIHLKQNLRQKMESAVEHARRLEKIFRMMHLKIVPRKCDEMDECIRQVSEKIKSTSKETCNRDLDVIEIVRGVEMLEIRKYNKLISLGNDLGNLELIHLLENSLEDEKKSEEIFFGLRLRTLNETSVPNSQFQIRKFVETLEEKERWT